MVVRWFTFLIPLFCFGCNTVPPEHMRTFQDAQSAFDAGNYRQSAALYEQLLGKGVRSGALYYNLGNAWAKADEPVRAVAAYYLAKRYIPRDPHLEFNLNAVLKNHGGTLPPPPLSLPDSSLVGFLFFWQNWVGFQTKIWVSLTLTALAVSGGVLFLFRQSRRLKRGLLGAAILAGIALASTGYDWYRFEGVRQVVVTTNTLPRKGNSEEYEPAFISPIPFGTLAVELDERSGWCLLRFPDGQEGWLPLSQMSPLQ